MKSLPAMFNPGTTVCFKINMSMLLNLCGRQSPIIPTLKVFVGNGYFDLATPFFATEYTFNHLGLDDSLQKNVSMGYYEAGHMMYLHRASLVKLKADLANIY